MDQTNLLMDEIQFLHQKLDLVANTLSLLNKKIETVSVSQRIEDETMRKTAYSSNIINKFLAGLHNLTDTELNGSLVESDANPNAVPPIPTTNQNLDQIPLSITKDQLRMLLKEVFDSVNSLPLENTVGINHNISSTITIPKLDENEERKKMYFWRRYKNKYNYIEELKPKLPPLKDFIKKPESLQNDVNNIVQNDINDIVQIDNNDNTQDDDSDAAQNDDDDTAQNDDDDTAQDDDDDTAQDDDDDTAQNDDTEITFTINDFQKKNVYEMLKSKLKNSPYDPFYFINNTRVTKLKIKMDTGETVIKPVSHVAPLVILQKLDDIFPLSIQNKKNFRFGKHFQSTSKINSNMVVEGIHPLPVQNKKKSGKHFQSSSKIDSNMVVEGIHPLPVQNKTKSGKHFQSTSKMNSNIVNDSNSNNTTAKMNKRKTRANKTKDIKESINTDVKTSTQKRSLMIKKSKNEPSKKKKKLK